MATVEDVQFRFNVTGNAVPQMKAVQNQMTRLNTQVRAGTRQMHDYARANQIASTATRKWAKGAMQQAGYQVGDFVVQVQNGTNWMQAFGQQGAQLAGVFGPMGAVVGAGIAIFSSLAIVFQKAGGAAKETKDDVVDLMGALKNVESSAKVSGEAFQRYLTDTFAGSEVQINSLLDRLETLRLVNLSQAIGGVMSDASLPLQKTREQFDAITQSIVANQKLIGESGETASAGAKAGLEKAMQAAKGFKKEVGLTTLEFQIFLENLDRVKRAATFEEMVAEIALMDKHLASVSSGPLEEFRNNLVKVLQAQGIFTRLGQEAADSAEGYDKAAKAVGKLADELGRVALSQVEARYMLDKGILPPGAEEDFPKVDKAYEAIRQRIESIRTTTSSAGGGASKLATKINTELSPEMERLKQIQEGVSRSFERGFESMIDGTGSVKDAFKAMAGDIIKELYRVFVVKQITGFVQKAFGGAVGGLLGIGGSATSLRPMARPPGLYTGGTATGQRPHIVGEKGPELFVPGRTGQVVANNKMGGGGQPVQVVYNFQGGVTEADLGRALPVLVERTKREVVDAVQRGGSVARAFR